MSRYLTIRIAVLALIVVAFAVQPASAQREMEYEQWVKEMERWQNRLDEANGNIETLEAEIDSLNGVLSGLQEQIDATWQEIYDMLGITPESIAAFLKDVEALEKDVAAFGRLSGEEIYQRRDELDVLDERLAGLRERPEALLTEYMVRLDEIGAQLENIRRRMVMPRNLTYTVVRGDYLWKIAGMQKHYGDPMKWMRIYSVNTDQIKDPDLIYPQQVFTIPKDIDSRTQYLVAKGDYLYSIADNLYRDPFKWRKIHEANQVLISDPNVIYPEMILTLPGGK